MNELTDLPPGVIGFESTGWVHARDYRFVIAPAVAKAAAQGRVRCVVVLDDFAGLTPGAVWHDLRLGVENFRAWERVALVTDHPMVSVAMPLFSWLAPGTLKRFSLDDRPNAIAWTDTGTELPRAVTPSPTPDP